MEGYMSKYPMSKSPMPKSPKLMNQKISSENNSLYFLESKVVRNSKTANLEVDS